MKCFVDQHRQLDIDTLTHGKPVELSEYWRNVVVSLGAGYKSGGADLILHTYQCLVYTYIMLRVACVCCKQRRLPDAT